MKLKKVIKEALKVDPLNDPEEQKRRYDICKGCDRYDAKNDTCLECGCYMEIKTDLKTNRNPKKRLRIEITHCPLGRWGDKDIANLYRERDGLEPLP